MGGMSNSFPAVIDSGGTRDVLEIYGIGGAEVKSRGGIESMHNVNFRRATWTFILRAKEMIPCIRCR